MKTPGNSIFHPEPSGLRRMMGLLLLKAGLTKQDEIERTLTAQREANARLGALLVQMGSLSEEQLAALLHMQQRLSDPQRALKVATGLRLRLGEMLVQSGRATPQQVDEALAEQARTGARLGRIAVSRGWLKPLELRRALRFQARQMDIASAGASMRLGEILVATGQITGADLESALERQRRSGRPLGAELVDAGCLRPAQLAIALRIQRGLASVVLCAVLACGAATAPADAAARPAPTSQAAAGALLPV